MSSDLSYIRMLALIVVFSLSIACLILTIVPLSTTVWVVSSTYGTIGIWLKCTNSRCAPYPPQDGIIRAIQGLFITAVIIQFFSVLVASLCLHDRQRLKYRICAGLLTGAGICTMIGMILTDKNATTLFGKLDYSFGYSYYLGWTSVGLCLGSGLFLILLSFGISNVSANQTSLSQSRVVNSRGYNMQMKRRDFGFGNFGGFGGGAYGAGGGGGCDGGGGGGGCDGGGGGGGGCGGD